MLHTRLPRILIGLALMCGLLGSFPGLAHSGEMPAVYTRAADSLKQPAERALLDRAEATGRVRVVVGLAMSLKDDEQLTEDQARAQLNTLRHLQYKTLASIGRRPTDTGIRLFSAIPAIALSVNRSELTVLFSEPDVVTVEESAVSFAQDFSYDMTLIEADKLWAKGRKGGSFAVAVLDTGIDESHPAFAGKIAAEGCFSNADVVSGNSSLCPGGVTSSTATGSAVYCGLPGCAHGTNVASIAIGNSGTYGGTAVSGTAPSARLLPVQVFTQVSDNLACNGSPPCILSYSDDQMAALEQVLAWRKKYPIVSANLSLGSTVTYSGPCDTDFPMLATIISKLRKSGIATVIAAGNGNPPGVGVDGGISEPACISSAVSVGSTGSTDAVSSFSNLSSQVAVMAPGENILGAEPGGGYDTAMSGTSQATPHVSGAFALLRGVAQPPKVESVISSLICAAQPVTRSNVTKPRMDVLWAYHYLQQPPTASEAWDFSSVSSTKPWTPLVGSWKARDGTYDVPSFRAGYWAATWFPNCQAGIAVSASMTRTDTDPSLGWNSGLMTEASVDQRNQIVSGYWYAYDKANSGTGVIWRLDNYNLLANSGNSTNLCIVAGLGVGAGEDVTLKVTSQGGSHVLYVNGTLVCSVSDSTYSAGQVLLMAAGDPSGATQQSLAVDAVSTSPAAAALGEHELLDLAGATSLAELGPRPDADPRNGFSPATTRQY